jgi:hypothetical protein
MTYQSMGALAESDPFLDRVTACCKEQALIFKDDTRPEFYRLADAVIRTPGNARGIFELVCVAPNVADVTDQASIPDADILAMVQAAWPVYGAIAYPAPARAVATGDDSSGAAEG